MQDKPEEMQDKPEEMQDKPKVNAERGQHRTQTTGELSLEPVGRGLLDRLNAESVPCAAVETPRVIRFDEFGYQHFAELAVGTLVDE
ncbi:hypothetical protein C439_06175 [Haloferax mediterranei ATCC 33500]|nr:hypothetical protein C439_06175 [Haloferax mediterranei ATCC 33500]